eukprot:6955916-Prymnesium_polylepis.1
MEEVKKEARCDAYVGTEDSDWHPDVLKKAVIDFGYHFHKLNLSKTDLASELKSGSFFIDGVQNNSFVKSGYRGKLERYLTGGGDDETDPRKNQGRWRHSIAVHHGR